MLLQNIETSLADDKTSVNEDDVYEDDWEEESEEKDSKNESKGSDNKEQLSSERTAHVSGNPLLYQMCKQQIWQVVVIFII